MPPNLPDPSAPLLQVRDLSTEFRTDDGTLRAVDGVSFTLEAGRTLALVGESGSGKSVTSLSMMRLLPQGIGRISGGQILMGGRDLARLPEREMQRIRGNDIAMIFQEPMTSLTPVYTIGDQIAEAILTHTDISRRQARRRAIELLDTVGIPDPEARARAYPHQLSGGMRQRVMIAIALSCNPKVLIADEPTTGLDVTIQAQILDLMRRLQRDTGMAILFITHDLGVVAEMADRVLVMYAGRVVEEAGVQALYDRPMMPYTQGLMASVPTLGATSGGAAPTRLKAIRGNIPSPRNLPAGCAFHPRCDFARPGLCTDAPPMFEDVDGDRRVRCARWRDLDLVQGAAQ
jgi:oligopeptide/dipeptide ABC transporter ATP-binding protein